MNKQELVAGYKKVGLDITVVKEEHKDLGDIFYVEINKKVSIKNLKSTEEDIKIILKTKNLLVVPDYEFGTAKIIIGNTEQPSYTSTKTLQVQPNSLSIPLGENIAGSVVHDFKVAPHLILAGATGTGKSYLLHHILSTLLMYNELVSIVPIDFKGTELNIYSKFSSSIFDRKYGTNIDDAHFILDKAVKLMNYRYVIFKEKNVADITEYNKLSNKKLEHIFIVVDELADLMISGIKGSGATAMEKLEQSRIREITIFLAKLAQKARGAGIHLILSTQRPTADIISGHIKANIPTRVALKTATSMESSIILDQAGAEDLTKGEFIYKGFTNVEKGRTYILNIDKVKNTLEQLKYIETSEYSMIKEKEYIEEKEQLATAEALGGLSYKASIILLVNYGINNVYTLIEKLKETTKQPEEKVMLHTISTVEYLENLGRIKSQKDLGFVSETYTKEYLQNWKIDLVNKEKLIINDPKIFNLIEINKRLSTIPLKNRVELVLKAITSIGGQI